MTKKNYRKVPKITLIEIHHSDRDYFKIGAILKILKDDIAKDKYEYLSIRMESGKLVFSSTFLPPIKNGRYSKYNQLGKKSTIRELPKVLKWFSHDIYPYGDTSRSTVSATYSKEVWRQEVWLPEFLTLSISLQSESEEYYYFIVQSDDILDKNSTDFQQRLLFNINLIQENCGSYQVFSHDATNEQMIEILFVNWELLPPGNVDITRLDKNFNNRPTQEQREISERYDYIQSFKPVKLIRGTNTFNQYFGAMIENNVVVLENTRIGNAIYVFHQDWDILSKLSRTELTKMNTDIFTRIPHVGNWKQVLKNTIEK